MTFKWLMVRCELLTDLDLRIVYLNLFAKVCSLKLFWLNFYNHTNYYIYLSLVKTTNPNTISENIEIVLFEVHRNVYM